MTGIRERIAAVQRQHANLAPNDPATHLIQQCRCGEWFAANTIDNLVDMWCEHVADAVIAELHPTRTCALCGRKSTQKFRAYRDGWVCQSIHACNRRKARR
jgi:hypothetical protein